MTSGADEPRAVRTITVGDFMTRELMTVSESDDLAFAEGVLRVGGIRHLPVLREGRLVGLVTHRDLLRTAGSHERRASAVSEIMVRELETAHPWTSLVVAARTMLARKFGCLPVVEADGRLVGIVTEADFVRFAADVVDDLDLVAGAASARDRS
jgi:CBS domain-containing protein